MADTAPIRLTVELRALGEPLAGCVYDADGGERRFSGWLGLIAAIDTVRAAGGRPQEHVRGTGR